MDKSRSRDKSIMKQLTCFLLRLISMGRQIAIELWLTWTFRFGLTKTTSCPFAVRLFPVALVCPFAIPIGISPSLLVDPPDNRAEGRLIVVAIV